MKREYVNTFRLTEVERSRRINGRGRVQGETKEK
jgi:hypothetical protein